MHHLLKMFISPALVLGFFMLALLASPAGAAPPASEPVKAPALLLAKVYHPGIALADYWVSEKYDGVRGFWDGEKLLTRGGERIAAPAWFTAGWPPVPMDGELWAGRGKFQEAVSTVRQQTPDDDAWRSIRFMVFDLPRHSGVFTERIPAIAAHVQALNQNWVQAVPQFKLPSHKALQSLLNQTVREGGEGLMLRRGASLYTGGRSDDLLKVKTHEDTEARVVGHVPGKGKHAGKVGALLVEMPALDGRPAQRFKLGAGLSDAERASPPPLNSIVTYRYRGFNDSGLPRFATLLRVRDGVEGSGSLAR